MAARSKSKKSKTTSGSRGPSAQSWAGRLLAKALAPLLVIVAIAALGAGATFGLRWALLKANPFFTLQKIDVQTDGKGLGEKSVIAILSEMGYREQETNLFDIDVRAIRERLEKAAVVESARVYRVLPNLLVVSFIQRRPVARLRAKIPRFVDTQGHVLLPWEADGFSLLPDIVGTRDVNTFRPGQEIDDEVLLGALQFLRLNEDYAERLDCRVYMIQLDYHPPEKLKLYVHRGGTFRENAQILVPVRNMEPALNRLAVIVRDRTGLGLPTGFVDVTYEENVPVRE
jgi:cell division septal protein FtsQ